MVAGPIHVARTSKLGKRLKKYIKSSDSLLPKYTTFYHLIYVVRWFHTLIYF